MIQTPLLSDHNDGEKVSNKCQMRNPLSNQTSWDTNRTTPIQFQNSSQETTFVKTRNINITITGLVIVGVARRCADTIYKRRVNSCVLNHIFWRGVGNQKIATKNWKCSLRRATDMTFSKIWGWRRTKNNRASRGFYQSINSNLFRAKDSEKLFSSLITSHYFLAILASHEGKRCDDACKHKQTTNPFGQSPIPSFISLLSFWSLSLSPTVASRHIKPRFGPSQRVFKHTLMKPAPSLPALFL